MPENVSDLLKSSLEGSRLDLLHLLAGQASALGMPLYLVGGVVRDVLLGRAVKDFDLVVEGESALLAESVLKKYGGRIMVHSRFGTATWVVNESTLKRLNVPALEFPEEDMSFDLISARSETYAQPGALPTVKFSSIDDDLRRRDFTINAMAVRLDGSFFGDLYDPLHGQTDLQNKLVRALHLESFVDDPTRIFRAVRYAERYKFEIEPETLRWINKEAFDVLSGLSGERLRHEFDLIFEEKNVVDMLSRLQRMNLLSTLHPALQTADHNRLSRLSDRLTFAYGKFLVPDILSFRQTLGWTLYLMDVLPLDVEAIEERFVFPALLAKAVRGSASLFADLSSFTGWKPSQWTFHLDTMPELSVYAVWLVTSEPALQKYLAEWQDVKPFTTGDDLKARGLEPGPRFKEILTRLRSAWLDGEVKTEEEEKELLNNLASPAP
jgi:tRNA nucleotidyltransferase (CCA-adding enzyme)